MVCLATKKVVYVATKKLIMVLITIIVKRELRGMIINGRKLENMYTYHTGSVTSTFQVTFFIFILLFDFNLKVH